MDLDHAFDDFVADEAKAWIAAGHPHPPPPEYLVKVSGTFDSPLSHRLNQPSFTCSVPENGETADPTNGCIQMVMGTAYNKTTLLYDQIHRRDTTSEGSENYPETVRVAHAKWTQRIWESSEAKVEVVYGEKCFKSLISKVKFTTLPLWGQYAGIILHLIHEENFQNAQEGYKYRKVVMFAHHPQHLFYASAAHPTLIHQEKILTIAAAIAGVQHHKDYYANRMFLRKWPEFHQRHFDAVAARYKATGFDFDLTKLCRNDNPEELINDSEGTQSIWEQAFEDRAHSIPALFELLPAAIEATKLDGNWTSPESFPIPVLNWWKGQKQILFFKATINKVEDILCVLRNCGVETPFGSQSASQTLTDHVPLLRPALKQIMEIQLDFLSECSARTRHEAQWCHYRFGGEPVDRQCKECDTTGKKDENPFYSVNRPGYIVALSKLTCKKCKARRLFIPIGSLWICGGHDTLQSTAPAYHKLEALQPMLASLTELTPSQQRSVETICLRCQGGSDAQTFIDEKPLWTLGRERPLYVGHRRTCGNCLKAGRPVGRWIPKNPGIPTISPYTLGKLAGYYRLYAPFIIASLLDHWPPSTREYRRGEDK